MITGELKNKIDSLWNVFAAGGMVNPLDVIEQITYLMFIHDLDEVDTRRVRDNLMLGLPYDSLFDGEYSIGEKSVPKNQLRWSVFRDFPAGRQFSLMQEWIFPFIKGLHADNRHQMKPSPRISLEAVLVMASRITLTMLLSMLMAVDSG